ncbi:acyl-CoA synthetase [Natronomonas sp.]|uniref:acyl-CoA synthetase n=1 Tax=Natronomonas sp. TaxID=2184060 RepID=UPI002622C6B1|nr:AMP-binding protein [Natronomonas sp.]
MTWHVTMPTESYERAREAFSWDLPADYNAAHDMVGKHDAPDRTALYQAYPDGRREEYTFADLDRLSDRLASALASRGIGEGDRIGVVLPQVPANPLTHLACWKLGAISMPLSVLFGPDGLGYRLKDSGAAAVVTDSDNYETVAEIRAECPALETVLEVDWEGRGHHAGTTAFGPAVEATEAGFEAVETGPDTPGIIMYTSGSTGPPKGALHTQSIWVGHCPAFRMYFELDVSEAVCWTPADWAWIGALGDLLFPAWHYGRPVVGYPMAGFDAETALEIMAEFDVTSTFLPPTAIRMLMSADVGDHDLAVEAICSGGEPLTSEILEWAETELDGVAVNEIYGQTEANMLVCNCQSWFPAQAGSMGKPVPGHEVAVIDGETGRECDPGEIGEIAVEREGNPVVFEEYWNEPEKTAAVRVGGYHRTGDLGERDEEGYVWFKSRDDDLIITSGYRVGPGEVEDAILEHPDVEQAGVVGIPDEMRGEIIKAFCQPVESATADGDLRESVRSLVKSNLAKHEYPREIEFVESLPTTTTGKIRRTELRERET